MGDVCKRRKKKKDYTYPKQTSHHPFSLLVSLHPKAPATLGQAGGRRHRAGEHAVTRRGGRAPAQEAGAARAATGAVAVGGRPRTPSREAGAARAVTAGEHAIARGGGRTRRRWRRAAAHAVAGGGGHTRRHSRRAATRTVGPAYPRTVDTARQEWQLRGRRGHFSPFRQGQLELSV